MCPIKRKEWGDSGYSSIRDVNLPYYTRKVPCPWQKRRVQNGRIDRNLQTYNFLPEYKSLSYGKLVSKFFVRYL